MSLIFDGVNKVTFPNAEFTGDFVWSFDMTHQPGSHVFLGVTNNADILWYTPASGINYFRPNFGGSDILESVVPYIRARITGTLTRVGSTVTLDVLYTATEDGTLNGLDYVIGDTQQDTQVGTYAGTVNISNMGSYSQSFLYSGQVWQLDFVGSTGGDRSYNLEMPVGSTTMTDTISGQDATVPAGLTFTVPTVPFGDISITSIPEFYGCKQRDINSEALFTVAGTINNGFVATGVEYSINDGATWILGDSSPTTTFTFDVTIALQKTLIARITNKTSETDTRVLSAVFHIIPWWQSNEAGAAFELDVVTLNQGAPIPVMQKEGAFYELEDPTSLISAKGSQWPAIASKYANAGVPVCVSNVALGGTAFTRWLKSSNDLYPRLVDAYNALGGVELITSLGGETDSQNGTSTAQMETWLNQMMVDLRTDFGDVNYGLTYFPVGVNTGTTQNVNNVRAAFTNVIAANEHVYNSGDLIGIDIDGEPGSDGLHITTIANLRLAADLRFTKFQEMPVLIPIPDNEVPSVTVTAPATGNVGEAVTLQATAVDNDGTIAQVEFFAAGVSLGIVTTPVSGNLYELSYTPTLAGTFPITAQATDNDGATTTSNTSNIVVSANNAAPSVTLAASPTNNVIAGDVITLTANPTDGDGTITEVEFFVGGQTLGKVTSAPWQTTYTAVQGSLSFTCTALDDGGLSATSSQVIVNVGLATSTLTISDVGNNPTGTFNTVLMNGNSLIYNDSLSYQGGVASVELSAPAGTIIKGHVFDNNSTSLKAKTIQGVTA